MYLDLNYFKHLSIRFHQTTFMLFNIIIIILLENKNTFYC